MDKQYFLELLHKYLNDKATDVEQQFLIKYYDLFLTEPDVIALLSDEQKEKLKKEINASIWQNIDAASAPGKKVLTINTRFLKIAAAAVLIGFCATIFLVLRTQPERKPVQPVAARKQKPDLFILLADGSKVILSYGSKLSYPSSFNGRTKREVYLQGEAFFDIKHIDSKPFVVHTGKLETTVLGTAFNVKDIPGDKTITVTVTRGRVKVSDNNKVLGIIIPNQQITYDKVQLNATQNRINASLYTTWAEKDDLYFEDVTVEAAARLLEARRKVKIEFADELVKSKRFTATFDKSESLDKELKIICEFNDATYSYDKEKTTITIKSKPQTNQTSNL